MDLLNKIEKYVEKKDLMQWFNSRVFSKSLQIFIISMAFISILLTLDEARLIIYHGTRFVPYLLEYAAFSFAFILFYYSILKNKIFSIRAYVGIMALSFMAFLFSIFLIIGDILIY